MKSKFAASDCEISGPNSKLDPNSSLFTVLKEARNAKGVPRHRFWFGSPCYWFLPLDFALHIVTPQIIAKPFPR